MMKAGIIQAYLRRYIVVRQAYFRLLLGGAFLLFVGGAQAAALSQGYHANQTIVPGTLVSLDSQNIVPASTSSSDNLLGVVVSAQDSLLAITSADDQVPVATSGQADVFVSNINGNIEPGDKITPSVISGVGMKTTESTKILGIAQEGFSPSSAGATAETIKDKSGVSHTVYVGEIPVLVDVAYYVAGQGNDSSIVPPYLQQLTNAIAGKSVSPLRIVVGMLVLLLAIISVTVLLYSAVRNSIISIGRNPLSQGAVYRSLLQVLLVVAVILAAAVGALYLILTR